jgi:polyphosphate glucokinase
MAPPRIPIEDQILAVDIGATNVKFCHVDIHGELLEGVRRRPTPYPCSPDRLIEALDERIEGTKCPRIGIGFPGEFTNGRVVRPGNLSRPGGVTTDVDPELEEEWRGYELQAKLCAVTGRDVRIVNDATLAALGSIDGEGVELVLTLGTGLGIALAIDGQLKTIRDVGVEIFVRGKTYDQTIGEHSRSMDEEHWGELLVMAVDGFVREFGAKTVHLAGGNARRVTPTLFSETPYRVVINGNQASIKGAAKLFYN